MIKKIVIAILTTLVLLASANAALLGSSQKDGCCGKVVVTELLGTKFQKQDKVQIQGITFQTANSYNNHNVKFGPATSPCSTKVNAMKAKPTMKFKTSYSCSLY